MARELDEPVRLADYDPQWPLLFAGEAERLRDALRLEVAAIEHIGSTGVPDMPAKPTIDIMIGVAVLPPAAALERGLIALGYDSVGEAGVSGRFHFRRRDAGRSFNVHVVALGGIHWRSNLALREYLRSDPAARARYAAAKQAAMSAGADMLLAYSREKAATIAELLAKALGGGG
jgi:GrpB-like predicted nucleotidyltransferase (UPF0157 family)